MWGIHPIKEMERIISAAVIWLTKVNRIFFEQEHLSKIPEKCMRQVTRILASSV